MPAKRATFLILLWMAPGFGADSVRLPDGEGRRIVQTACVSCHGADRITAKKRRAEEWAGIVRAMIERGAQLSEPDKSLLTEYLVRNFAETDRAKMLYEDICTVCHDTRRIESRALSREEWRDEIKGMISEGAALTDEEVELLVEYLAKHFGRK
jgi:cytochrome c5